MKLPRPQFSLRTLLIAVTLLAIPCAYVAHEAQIVRHRNEMVIQVRTLGGKACGRFGDEPSDLPWIRILLGDDKVFAVYIPSRVSQDEADKISAAFPEAVIDRVADDY